MMLKPLCDLRVICTYVMIQPLSCMSMQQHSLVKIFIFSNQVTELVMIFKSNCVAND